MFCFPLCISVLSACLRAARRQVVKYLMHFALDFAGKGLKQQFIYLRKHTQVRQAQRFHLRR